MVRLLVKKNMPYILCVLVILCLLFWSNFAFAEGIEQDGVVVEERNVLNTENDSEEKLSSLLSKSDSQNAEEHLVRMQEQLECYKDVCGEDPTIQNAQDDGLEKMISIYSKVRTDPSTEEHYLKIKEQLSDYKKGIENYVD